MTLKLRNYLENLRGSRLLDEGQLNALLASAPPYSTDDDVEVLGKFLIAQGALTPWQHRMIRQGVRNGFFVGKHKLLGRIGVGGMSIVYLARHLQLQRHVAIKLLDSRKIGPGPGLERFFRESRATASLEHPNVVRVYDFDTVGPHHYLVLEYIDGPNLQDLIEAVGPMPLAPAAHYMMQAANGLAAVHAAGLIHRDVKPGNLLVSTSGSVKLSDLGLARQEDSTAARLTVDDGGLLGTIDYVSPEQAYDSHHVSAPTDVYSLGGTFYFLLTGSPPFPGGTLSSKLLRHQMANPSPLENYRPGLPTRVEQLILKMLAKRPEDRPTAEEVRNEIAGWSDLGLHNLLETGGCRPDSLQRSGATELLAKGTSSSSMDMPKPAGWKSSAGTAPTSTLDLMGPLRRANAATSTNDIRAGDTLATGAAGSTSQTTVETQNESPAAVR